MPEVVGSVLYGADRPVAEMVASLIPHMREVPKLYSALGVVRKMDGVARLIGGVIFHNFRGFDMEVSIGFVHPGWARPSTLRRLFVYPFVQCDAVRITAVVAADNVKSQRISEGVGFVREGLCRKAIAGATDAIIYGMLREECRFLKD